MGGIEMNDHIPDLTKMISDTPISDSTPHSVGDLAMVCRRLERKLAATRKYLSEVSERIKRLEEAGDELLRDNDDMANINRWHKAKYE
jgi:hypothetical protein